MEWEVAGVGADRLLRPPLQPTMMLRRVRAQAHEAPCPGGREAASSGSRGAAQPPRPPPLAPQAIRRPAFSPHALQQHRDRLAGGQEATAPQPTSVAPGPSRALQSLALSNVVSLPRRQLSQRQRAASSGLDRQQQQQRPRQRLKEGASVAAVESDQVALAEGAAAADAPLTAEATQLVLLCTAVAFICSIDRAAMSVALLPMSSQYSWDDSTKGAVSAAFFGGYMVRRWLGGNCARALARAAST